MVQVSCWALGIQNRKEATLEGLRSVGWGEGWWEDGNTDSNNTLRSLWKKRKYGPEGAQRVPISQGCHKDQLIICGQKCKLPARGQLRV